MKTIPILFTGPMVRANLEALEPQLDRPVPERLDEIAAMMPESFPFIEIKRQPRLNGPDVWYAGCADRHADGGYGWRGYSVDDQPTELEARTRLLLAVLKAQKGKQ